MPNRPLSAALPETNGDPVAGLLTQDRQGPGRHPIRIGIGPHRHPDKRSRLVSETVLYAVYTIQLSQHGLIFTAPSVPVIPGPRSSPDLKDQLPFGVERATLQAGRLGFGSTRARRLLINAFAVLVRPAGH
jgi:hypothetical protein